MRKPLKKLNKKRLRFSAIIEKYGEKPSFGSSPTPTILLKDVVIFGEEEILTDHLWFARGKSWSHVRPGDRISFDARVGSYIKGYQGHREDVFNPTSIDYRLERPTKIEVVENLFDKFKE